MPGKRTQIKCGRTMIDLEILPRTHVHNVISTVPQRVHVHVRRTTILPYCRMAKAHKLTYPIMCVYCHLT